MIYFILNLFAFKQVTTLLASLNYTYCSNKFFTEQKVKEIIDFHCENGVLFHVESLLSCFGDELNMMTEHFTAINSLNSVFVHLPESFCDPLPDNSTISIRVDKLIFKIFGFLKLFIKIDI